MRVYTCAVPARVLGLGPHGVDEEPEQARSLAESKCGGSGAGGGGDGGGGGGGDSMQPKSRSSTTSLIVASCDYPVRLIVSPPQGGS